MTARAPISCDDVEPLLSPCVDGELLDDDSATVTSHVARCDACRTRLLEMQTLKAALGAAGARVELPLDLEASLQRDLARAARPSRALRFGVAAALAASVAGAFVVVTQDAPAPAAVSRARAPVVAAALQRHRLELPVDVASPDPRPVQEFLAQRIGHRVRVPRLEQLGFGLQGGRVVDVEDHPGAQLVYAGGYGQRLSVVAIPDPDGALAASTNGAASEAREGDGELRVRVVAADGTVYAIVGEMDEHRLERLSHELTR